MHSCITKYISQQPLCVIYTATCFDMFGVIVIIKEFTSIALLSKALLVNSPMMTQKCRNM